jgi:hypothetical protein
VKAAHTTQGNTLLTFTNLLVNDTDKQTLGRDVQGKNCAERLRTSLSSPSTPTLGTFNLRMFSTPEAP